MTFNCPNCHSSTTEIRDCDKCGRMGCHRCLRKVKNEWICLDCKNNDGQKELNIFSMFD
ncbi:MAG: hypothetical protein QXJ06_01160 [Candidatus Aenigmatarchaeota archaeon]